MSEKYEVKFEGKVLAKVILQNEYGCKRQKVATFMGECDGTYQSDWQCDGGYYHDEGEADYDEKDIKAKYPDEFEVITATGDKTDYYGENGYKIVEIVEVFEENLEME